MAIVRRDVMLAKSVGVQANDRVTLEEVFVVVVVVVTVVDLISLKVMPKPVAILAWAASVIEPPKRQAWSRPSISI